MREKKELGLVMSHMDSRATELDVDLESGGTTSEEDGRKDNDLSGENAAKMLRRGSSGLDGSTRGGDSLSSYAKVLNSGDISPPDAEILSNKLREEMVNYAEKKMAKEKWKKSSKKPPKPPLPPIGPSLDATDARLIKEISELAMLKRKRIQQVKDLKKKKTEKVSSFNTNLFAMVVTILFCLVIILQGLLGSRV